MVFKGLITATASIALMAMPAVAAAQSSRTVAPAEEAIEADSQLGGGFLIPLLALGAVILGLLVLLDDDEEELPVSP